MASDENEWWIRSDQYVRKPLAFFKEQLVLATFNFLDEG